jgi:hypothetical protein
MPTPLSLSPPLSLSTVCRGGGGQWPFCCGGGIPEGWGRRRGVNNRSERRHLARFTMEYTAAGRFRQKPQPTTHPDASPLSVPGRDEAAPFSDDYQKLLQTPYENKSCRCLATHSRRKCGGLCFQGFRSCESRGIHGSGAEFHPVRCAAEQILAHA